MKGISKHLTVGIALACVATAHAQSPQPPRWAGIASSYKNNAPNAVRTCHNGTAYTLHWTPKYYSLQAFPREGEAKQRIFHDKLSKDHQPIVTLAMVGDKPCIVHADWTKGSTMATAQLQAYTADLLATGNPIALGDIPVDPKHYGGGRIEMEVLRSPDGSKTLLVHKRTLGDGSTQNMFWAFDQDLQLLWKSTHRPPLRSSKQPDRHWLTNQGTLMLRTHGTEITPVSNKGRTVPAQHFWYLVNGDEFGPWPASITEPRMRNAIPLAVGDTWYITLLDLRNKGPESTAQWHLFRLKEDLSTEAVASGTPRTEPQTLHTGLEHGAFHVGGAIHLALPRDRGMHLIKLAADSHAEQWAKDLEWNHLEFSAVNGHAISVDLLDRDQANHAVESRPWSANKKSDSHYLIPVATVVDAKGKTSVHLITELEHTEVRFGEDTTTRLLEDCNCVLVDNYRNTADAMGMLRIDMLQPAE